MVPIDLTVVTKKENIDSSLQVNYYFVIESEENFTMYMYKNVFMGANIPTNTFVYVKSLQSLTIITCTCKFFISPCQAESKYDAE